MTTDVTVRFEDPHMADRFINYVKNRSETAEIIDIAGDTTMAEITGREMR